MNENFNTTPPQAHLALIKNRKFLISIVLFVIISAIIIGLFWNLKIGQKGINSNWSNQDATGNLLFKEQPIYVHQIGETAKIGSLEINLYNYKESSFQTLEVNKEYQRIEKKYIALQIRVFNISSDETENLSFGLLDDLGNQYLPDYSISSYVPDLKEFGRNMNIYPRIIQEGYIFFSDINEAANEIRLVFGIESPNERIDFSFKRLNANE